MMKWLGLATALVMAAACGGVSGSANDFDGDGHESVDSGGDDCNDLNSAVHPAGVEVCGDGVDQDCNGEDLACSSFDRDGDGYSPMDGDCNDDNIDINPGATETPYNGVDDDCDTATVDDDLDGDGFSQMGGGDCDDDDDTVFPGADEIPYDTIDQDCSSSDLDDVDQDGFVSADASGDDCDDLNPAVNPGRLESPFDGTDQNCDGFDTIGDNLTAISNSTVSTQLYAAVVANGTGYLAVWSDLRSETNYEIRGRFLDATGTPVGDDFLIRSSSGQHTVEPEVAFDGTNYLVTWNEGSASNSNQVYAQRISSTGSAVGGLISIATGTANEHSPDVDFSGGTYLVVYHDGTYVSSRTVSTTGTVGAAKTVHAGTNMFYPRVRGDGTNFLVIFRDYDATDVRYELRGQIVKSADGNNLLVSPVEIATDYYSSSYGSVAWDGTNYLVVYRTNKGDMAGQFLSAGGILATAVPGFWTGFDARFPSLAYVDGYYVALTRMREPYPQYSIAGQKIATDGSLLGTSFWVSGTGASHDVPAVASGGTGWMTIFPRIAQDSYDVFASHLDF